MSTRTITLEHEGETYRAKIATIKSTHLGPEDHGIFTSYLHCDGDGWGVGVGGYVLGGAFAIDHIKAVMETVGVGRWEDIPGKRVLVLFDNEHGGAWGQVARGIAHLSDEKRVLDYAKFSTEWQAAHEAEAVSA